MKRRISVLLWIFVFFTSIHILQAQPAGAGPALGQGMVGVAAAVNGVVQLLRTGVGKNVSSGEEIYLGDDISTDEKGNLQVLLLDETTFTIGPNSSIVIDKFVYDPTTDAGLVNARVVKGTFRFITGKIARKKPEDMQVALPAGTIGIRGTMVMGSVKGERSLVVLTGPGSKNNTGNKQGEIIVSNEENGKMRSVDINKTGFGTVIEGAGKGPSTPFQVPADQIAEMTGDLSPSTNGTSDDEGGEEGSATEDSGQDTVDAGEDLSATESVGELSAGLAEQVAEVAQKSAESSGSIQDGITTIANLLSIQTGQFHFDSGSIPLSPGGGTYSFHYDLDFGARTAGGGNSRIAGSGNTNIEGTSPWTIHLPPVNFSDGGGGLASYTYSGVTDGSGCVACSANVTVTAFNAGGVVAANGTVSATISDTGTASGSGSSTRLGGLS